MGAFDVPLEGAEALVFPLVLLQVKAVGPIFLIATLLGSFLLFPLVLLQVKAVGF